MKDFTKIPFEIIVQILSRLPPKALMRFKCVHKSWHALYNNPQFVSKHIHLYNQGSSSTCILFRRYVEQEIVFSFLHLDNDNNVEDDDRNLHFSLEDLHFPLSMGLKSRGPFIELPSSDESVHIVGHCDGILCLDLYTWNLVLYNPAINEFNILPQSCLQGSSQYIVGFGFHPKSKDYLVVRMVSSGQLDEDDGYTIILPPKAEIYTLSTNSWKEIKAGLQTETTSLWGYSFQTCMKGIFYWLGYEDLKEYSYYERDLEDVKYLILLFDTCDGLFHNVKLPECFYEFPIHEFRLAGWTNESIVLFGFYRGGDRPFEIWVMDDFASRGVECSWTKHLSIVPKVKAELKIPCTLELWKSDEVLILATNECIVSYNFITDALKYLPIHYVTHSNYQQVVCVSSIVSVKGRNKLDNNDAISHTVSCP